MFLTVSAANSADDEHLHQALRAIGAHEPAVSIAVETTGTHRLSANSKSQLESICDRICDNYRCGINVSPIRVAFLETIRSQAEAEGKYIRQTGGQGNYAHCMIRIEPNDPASGYEFISEIKTGAVPEQFVKPIDDGIQEAMKRGILRGFPLVDVKATLYDGSYHEVDSNETAFKFAGSIALTEAAKKASPVLLEPVMALEIDVPEELTGATRREIRLHRGRIESEEAINGFCEIKAIVPLTELLTSASLGSAGIPMEFAGYEAVSDDGSSMDRDSGVTANKPNPSRPRGRFDAASPQLEDE